jgi:uncharacterized SAM-binding protein YcdF (DUF218 family)
MFEQFISSLQSVITISFEALGILLVAALFIALFLIPTWVARRRKAEHFWWIVLANVVVGGTGAGWVIVLIWALHERSTSLPDQQDIALATSR